MPRDLSADISAALSKRDAARFCEAILPQVSRTFALGIRVLRGELGQAVLDAYLLCRIADTVEDAPLLAPEAKARLFDEFIDSVRQGSVSSGFAAQVKHLGGNTAHLTLSRNADLVFEHFAVLSGETHDAVVKWVTEMASGMRKFVLKHPDGIRIRTLEEYREYCYYVAGTVGHMLTDLWRLHAPGVDTKRHIMLARRCRAFAEALQTVNILKDVAVDAVDENSIYVPDEWLRAAGSSQAHLLAPELLHENRAALSRLVDLAWHDLDEAYRYLLDIPRRAYTVRLFCIFPLLLAYATLRDLSSSNELLTNGSVVKISRREVKSLLAMGMLIAASNSGVRWLVNRVRARPFHLLPT